LDLQQVGAGGGEETENITVHAVPFEEIDVWLQAARDRGCLLDARIYAGLYFITQHLQKNG
ncbi:MAG TPA: NUDIX hydrolase, partial [Planctomycetaceae bacterium]|nr:NUDIX hydrolase [Planctomycetaceae bacterium]